MNTQVVLITGALTGIGRATALAFANEGAQVVVSGRHDDEGQKLVGEIRKKGAEAEFIGADVRREGTHEVGGARSGRDGRPSECHRPRTNRNTNAEPLHENGRGKDWFGLDRAAKARGKTRGNCSSYRFCFLRQSLLHHGSFLPRRWRQNGSINSPASGTPVRGVW